MAWHKSFITTSEFICLCISIRPGPCVPSGDSPTASLVHKSQRTHLSQRTGIPHIGIREAPVSQRAQGVREKKGRLGHTLPMAYPYCAHGRNPTMSQTPWGSLQTRWTNVLIRGCQKKIDFIQFLSLPRSWFVMLLNGMLRVGSPMQGPRTGPWIRKVREPCRYLWGWIDWLLLPAKCGFSRRSLFELYLQSNFWLADADR